MTRYAHIYLILLLVLGVVSIECAPSRTAPPPTATRLGPVAPAINSEENSIRSVLSDVALAMEEGDVYKVLAHVSASYRDKEGRDYTDLRLLLQRVFDRYGTIEIARSGTKVTIDENRAAVTESFVTFARGRSGTSEEPFTLRGVTSVFLEKIAGRWFIVEWGESS